MSFDFVENENKKLKFWEENDIFGKLKEKIKGKKPWAFLDGPITANNPMGVHHAWGRTYKDFFQRFNAMRGFDLRFQNGFDCQGLHVEVEVEKELGFENKKDIEKYGIDNFVNKCKERVHKCSQIQTNQSIRLGQWADWKNSYYTMSDENNYAIWDFLKKCRDKGYLYKGKDVVPWCLRCGTAISQHEILTEEYKEITHNSVFIKLPIKENTYFLAWTTTPWTLPGNVCLAVNPYLKYVEVEKSGEKFILLQSKSGLIENGTIVKEFLGKELENIEYQGMFDELPAVKESMKEEKHKVILWEDVSEEEGTGIVHVAPGCGQEDFQLIKKIKFPVIDPLNDESRYKKGFDFLEGKLASDVNEEIFEKLKKKGILYKTEEYTHRYPTCWRCKKELIFRLVDEWYVSMEKLRKPLMEMTDKIKWIPGFGKDRELDWLKNMQDWLISKKRYWGLALPIFECQCGNFEVIGGKEELKERAVEGWDKFEGNSPHRPWVDNIKIKCSKCGEIISRIPDVGNPWLDAGITPFSTLVDPETKKVSYYDDKKYWEKWFPMEVVCESFPGQFKNWFYVIIVMSTVLEDTNPVKRIFGYGLVKDEKGEEMHKSKGNAIWFDDAVEKIGADPMRWMYLRQNPSHNLLFGYKPLEEVKRKLLTLYNSFSFFNTYVKEEERPKERIITDSKNILDKWIISRMNNLIKQITEKIDDYDTYTASSLIENFFINDLSLWYIRRSRNRFHTENREEVIKTFYYVLLNTAKIIAPIIPFFAEEMYQSITSKKDSVHLCDFPEFDNQLIDQKLEEKMNQAREISNKALSLRAESGIKVRQPLMSLQITNIDLEEEILNLIKEEINVKEIISGKEFKLETEITEELKEEGRKREFIRHVKDLRKKMGLTSFDKISVITTTISGMEKEEILKETGAEEIRTVEKEIEDVDEKKEVEIEKGKKEYIGIKK